MALNPFDTFQFNSRRQGIAQQAKLDSDVLQRDRVAFESGAPIQMAQFQRGWSQARETLPRGLGRRGMLNSGVNMRRQADFGYSQIEAYRNLMTQFAQAQQSFADREAGIAGQRQFALDQLEAERAARRVEQAAMMRQVLGR
jgi:hypothetical protein